MDRYERLALFAMNAGMTAGELLKSVLDEKGITKAKFGRMVAVHQGKDSGGYQKTNRWTQNKGFHEENRRIAAAVLKLPADYFDHPERFGDEAARRAEEIRKQVFQEFVVSDTGKRLQASSPEVLDSLDRTPIPPGLRASVDFYVALALVFSGALTTQQAAQNLAWNERLRADLTKKKKSGKRKPKE